MFLRPVPRPSPSASSSRRACTLRVETWTSPSAHTHLCLDNRGHTVTHLSMHRLVTPVPGSARTDMGPGREGTSVSLHGQVDGETGLGSRASSDLSSPFLIPLVHPRFSPGVPSLPRRSRSRSRHGEGRVSLPTPTQTKRVHDDVGLTLKSTVGLDLPQVHQNPPYPVLRTKRGSMVLPTLKMDVGRDCTDTRSPSGREWVGTVEFVSFSCRDPHDTSTPLWVGIRSQTPAGTHGRSPSSCRESTS